MPVLWGTPAVLRLDVVIKKHIRNRLCCTTDPIRNHTSLRKDSTRDIVMIPSVVLDLQSFSTEATETLMDCFGEGLARC